MTLQNIVETHMEHNALYVSRDPRISKPPSYILHHVSAYCKRAIRFREDTPPTEDVGRDGVPCNQCSGGPSVKINLIQSMLAQESPTDMWRRGSIQKWFYPSCCIFLWLRWLSCITTFFLCRKTRVESGAMMVQWCPKRVTSSTSHTVEQSHAVKDHTNRVIPRLV